MIYFNCENEYIIISFRGISTTVSSSSAKDKMLSGPIVARQPPVRVLLLTKP